MHSTPLLSTLVGAIVLAFLLGSLANRLRIPPLIGYLVAGILIGPFTPGFIANQSIANELAEIGVILLMFGVGLHFFPEDLLSVKWVAIPGALVQIALASLMGMGIAHWIGWPISAGIVFGLALSVASTVVLLKALEELNLEHTYIGRVAVGWLIVEDLVMVLILVLIPVFANLYSDKPTLTTADLPQVLFYTLLKVVAFVALMLIVGKRVVPWFLKKIAHMGNPELFRLGVLAVALGIAYSASHFFGVSFALGAFFAGVILAGSELSHRAAAESLPLRDAFAVVFFVSVGMLFDPSILIEAPLALLATVLVIIVGKSLVAWLIMRFLGKSSTEALIIAASLAQIGEFSFILASLSLELGLINKEAHALIIASAALSILVNPFLFKWIVKRHNRIALPAPTLPHP